MTESTRKLFGDGHFEAVPKADFLELVTLWADELGITPAELKSHFDVAYLDWLDTLAGKRHADDVATERMQEHWERRGAA